MISNLDRILLVFCAVVWIVALVLACSGCSLPKPKTPAITIDTPTPDPGGQLWQAAKKSNWLVTASIVGIAAGVFALVSGSAKLGTASIASASVSLFMALAVSRFALWMAVFGLIGSVAAALFSILVRRKALVEIIKGVQKAKDEGSVAYTLKKELAEQSSTTKKIVGDIKNKLKLAGKI